MNSFSITLEVNSIRNETPLEATKKALELIKQHGDSFIYFVEDDITRQKYIVDLNKESVEEDNS